MLGGLAEIPRTMWESLGLKEKGGGGMKQSRRRDKNRETEEKRESETNFVPATCLGTLMNQAERVLHLLTNYFPNALLGPYKELTIFFSVHFS